MTVIELLSVILKGYPGASGDALASFKPVFYARLQRHEGDALARAYAEVFATFKPTARQPFPIPVDFEAHLPSGRLDLGKEGGRPIRQWIAERQERRKRVLADWDAGQGAKIKANRPHAVYSACNLMAIELAPNCGDRLVLTAEQITLCEEQALSRARVEMFGPLPKTEEAMQAQREQVRQAWAANPHPVRRAA